MSGCTDGTIRSYRVGVAESMTPGPAKTSATCRYKSNLPHGETVIAVISHRVEGTAKWCIENIGLSKA